MATNATQKTGRKNAAKKTASRTRNVGSAQQGQRQFTMHEVVVIAASAALNAMQEFGVSTVGTMSADNVASASQTPASAGSSTRQPSTASDSGSATASTRTRSATNRATRSSTATGGKVGRPVKANSGLSRARVRFAEMHGRDRKDVVKSFIDDLGLGKGVANTYYHIIKNPPAADAPKRKRAKKTATAQPQQAAASA